jgi:hypothetical protein
LKAAGRVREHPPAVPFVLSVGVTGHRSGAIPAASVDHVRSRLKDILEALAAKAAAIHRAESAFFGPESPRLIFISALADGADQMGAEIALGLGFELHAILPFGRDLYRADLASDAAREKFDELLNRSNGVLELPGGADDALQPYVMAGLATVAQSDLLIAVWDGLPPRGRGGTAEVVDLAVRKAKPLVRIPVDQGTPLDLRWGAFEPSFVTDASDPATIRAFSASELDNLVERLIAPPSDPRERAFVLEFLGEHRRPWKLRIEYPLLLAAAGITRLKRRHWRADQSVVETHQEWQEFREACDDADAVAAPLAGLERSYEWADSLAGHFAQSFRSGHVFNFILGAVAVLLGTLNLVLPRIAIFLEITLFLVVLAILANTWAANQLQWHRRWLDYRQLAERLRPMRSLKLLGIAAPDPPGTDANPVCQRWIEWYSAAVWRAIGCPVGHIDGPRLGAINATIAKKEIEPQVAYHHKAARQVGRLDHRLGVLGYAIFTVALASSAVLLTAFVVAPDWVHDNYNWFTVISAGLPAIGTAVVGIRVQGDHSASAIRSEQSAIVLGHIGKRLGAERSSLVRAADLTEQAARAMLGDLDEWRLLNQQHDLSIG